jgi:hypothetical protein
MKFKYMQNYKNIAIEKYPMHRIQELLEDQK